MIPALGYTLLNHGDASIESFRGVFFKIRRALGTTAFGINEVRMPAGFEGFEHDETETGHEEVYIVLAGAGIFTVDADVVSVAGGDYLRVDAEAVRKVVAGIDGLTYVVIAAKPKPQYDGRPSL
jgi:quercetin dioxygenase-like cupin family protein